MDLEALLGGGMGRQISEPETRTPKERVIARLQQAVDSNNEAIKTAVQNRDDALSVIEHLSGLDDNDPVVESLSRMFY